MRKYIFGGIVIALAAITMCLGVQFKAGIPDCGIANLSNFCDLEGKPIKLSYAYGADVEEELTEDSFYGGKYDGIDEAEIIAVVSPTGNLIQTDGSIGQEFTVHEILKGENLISENQKAYVYRNSGICAKDGRIEYENTENLMIPGCDYVIFMDASPLNEYQAQVYILKTPYFGYVKISDEVTPTLKGTYTEYELWDLKNCEFFSTSEVVTNLLNKMRKEILEEFIGDT